MDDKVKEMTYRLEHGLFAAIKGAAGAEEQDEYERYYDQVFHELDLLDEELEKKRYIAGSDLTEADERLFDELVRFDLIYYFAYRLNGHRIEDYPHMFRYAKEVYQRKDIHDKTDFEEIKRDFYLSQDDKENPYHLVMNGPDMSRWEE